MTFTMPVETEQFELPHTCGDRNFVITVWRPRAASNGASNLPVLFLLDADVEFSLAAEIARLNGVGDFWPTPMVVGVGYGVDYLDCARLRTADLTPPLGDAGKQALGNLVDVTGDVNGGAQAFLSFLIDTLGPEISRRYPEASITDRILFGHSLGGLFTSYALLTRPEAFATFLPTSPSLWWDNFSILSHLPALAERLKTLPRQPRVLVSVGGTEQDPPTSVPQNFPISLAEAQALAASTRMVDAAVEFAQALRDAGLSEVRSVVFAEEDHGTVLPAAIQRGISFALPRDC